MKQQSITIEEPAVDHLAIAERIGRAIPRQKGDNRRKATHAFFREVQAAIKAALKREGFA